MKNRRNLLKILAVYQTINNYVTIHHETPSFLKLVELKCGASTSVISYYFDEMVELGMAVRTNRGSIFLLPLNQAHPKVKKMVGDKTI